jgi:hypothetical protein
MTTFAVTNSDQILPAVNYLLSNLDTQTVQGNITIPGNVLVANTTTGVVSQSGNATVFGYLYQYVNLRYSNNATGTDGFSTSSGNFEYFGVFNSVSSSPSNNPASYQWYEVDPPFDTATSRTLYYSAIGGRQIQWAAASSPPSSNYVVTVANVAIDLDVVTTAAGTPGERGPVVMAGVITTADPNLATSATLTGWFEASRSAVTAPIGTGLTPVAGDTASFTWAAGPGAPQAAYEYNGSLWVPVNGQVISGNVIVQGTIAGNAMIANTITATQIATGTITATQIAANTITATQIATGTITATQIAANTITGNNIAAGTITTNNFTANTIQGNIIAAGTITATQLAANAITANTVVSSGAVLGSNASLGFWLDGTTGNARFGNNLSIGNSVTIGSVISGGILTANSVGATQITNGSITTQKFTANTINGNVILAGTITAEQLAANAITANTVVSTGATLGSNTSPGFWLDGTTGNARFGNSVSIGNLLAVGNNATIGGNLTVSGLINQGVLANSVVDTNNIVDLAVTNSSFGDANPSPTQIVYVNDPTLYPNNTRGEAVPTGIAIIPTTTSATQGSKILVNYQTYISSATNSEYNLVELWKDSVTFSSQYNLKHIFTAQPFGNAAFTGTTSPIFCVGTNGGTVYSSNFGTSWVNASNANITTDWTATFGYANVNYNGNVINPLYPGTYFFNKFDSAGIYYAGNATVADASTSSNLGGVVSSSVNFTNNSNSTINDVILLTSGFIPGSYDTIPVSVRPVLYVGNSGAIYTTSGYLTGNTWNSKAVGESSGVTNNLYAVGNDNYNEQGRYENSMNLVAVGSQGTILTNSRTYNGSTGALVSSSGWASRISGVAQDLNGVGYSYGETVWIAVGDSGTILRSTTSGGTSWTQITSPTTANLNDVWSIGSATSGGPFVDYWVACGDGGVILVSTDAGLTWTSVSSPASDGSLVFLRNLNSIAYTQETLAGLLIAGDGIIMRSYAPYTSWTVVYDAGYVQNANLTRVEFYGSFANVFTTTQPSVIQKLGNNQVIAGTFIDTNFTAGDPIKYYLLAGSLLANNAVYVQGSSITATEYKR